MLRNVGVNRHHENPTVLVDTNSLRARDRKSTRLNSSHDQISYAVFCLKKKKKAPLLKSRDTHYPQVLVITHMSKPTVLVATQIQTQKHTRTRARATSSFTVLSPKSRQ